MTVGEGSPLGVRSTREDAQKPKEGTDTQRRSAGLGTFPQDVRPSRYRSAWHTATIAGASPFLPLLRRCPQHCTLQAQGTCLTVAGHTSASARAPVGGKSQTG